MSLLLRSSFPKNVFELMGKDENSATYSLGWTLERSPCFASLFVSEIAGTQVDYSEVRISLQKSGDDRGFTDIELRCGDELHAIIEAKQGLIYQRNHNCCAIAPGWISHQQVYRD